MIGAEATCPQCGAPVRFGAGESLATVCAHCRSALLRDGARLESAGKVPDLVSVDTRLAVGAAGRVENVPFVVLGRLQLDRGDAPWNEWYATTDTGYGWLAEAQGRLFFTRPVEAPSLPEWSKLSPGGSVDLPVAGRVTVDETASARLVSFEGELPFRPRIGFEYRYADATGADGAFATLDYGADGDAPALYVGREVDWARVTLSVRPPPAAPAAAARPLSCPSCGGSISLRDHASRSATCPACRTLLDVKKGDLRVVDVAKQREDPPVPLGSKGVLRGMAVEVIGWLRRSTVIEGTTYRWNEYLLFGPGGYRWLSESAGHWLYLEPVAAGKVIGSTCEGRTYRHFQGCRACVDSVQGEFYWEVRVGEEVRADDYVDPPYLLSREKSGKEVAWTRGVYLEGAEVFRSLGLRGSPREPEGVGAAQPNPWSPRAAEAWKIAVCAVLSIFVLALLFLFRNSGEGVMDVEVPIVTNRVTLTEPFDLRGGPQAVKIEGAADVNQGWVGLDAALIEDATGQSEVVGIEMSHYEGVDSEGRWSEGSTRGSAVIGGVRDGRYVLRFETLTEMQPGGTLPGAVRVRVVRRVFLLAPLLFSVGLVLLFPAVLAFLHRRFEVARWEESDHPMTDTGPSLEDEE